MIHAGERETGGTAGREEAGSAARWPDWPISRDAAAALPRYVSVAHAGRWVPTDLRGSLPGAAPGPRVTRAGQLYQALAARRIPYASVPWNPAAYDAEGRPACQRVRTPAETIEGPATCLDLVLVFAAMAISADLRPLIALRYSPSPHALVVLELSGDVRELGDAARYDSELAPCGFTPRQGEPGIWDASGTDGGPVACLARSARWLPVDVVGVTRGSASADFEDASGPRRARAVDIPGAQWTLVDVRRVLAATGQDPYPVPHDRSVPPIHGYLPGVPGFREFAGRGQVLRRLEDLVAGGEPATIVIQAPPGYGKSMLAHRLAVAADNGCGWFLNATDTGELRRSLAQAERGERAPGGERPGPDGEKADPGDDLAFAAAALDRLRASGRPWVVVADNCDSPPDTAGLTDLLPRPHAPGQVVIITTTHDGWLDYATSASHRVKLQGLGNGDLRDLGLPAGLGEAVAGRPLIALALAALRDHGDVELPADSRRDGPSLVWDLLRGSPLAGADVVGMARLLAWLPPEPVPEFRLLKIGAWDTSPGDILARLRFVTRIAAPAPGQEAGEGTAAEETGEDAGQEADGSQALLMHRLFAAAVREQTWTDEPGAAAGAIGRLLGTGHGRWLLITAADSTALTRLGESEVARAARSLAQGGPHGHTVPGLLWYGLGHVFERRGPVAASRQPFELASQALDPAVYPYEVAESQIGVARVIYHPSSAAAELEAARALIERARTLLESSPEPRARTLREQGNALAWLIEQRLTKDEPDPRRKAVRYQVVYDNLWMSFAERLRIARGLDARAPVARTEVPRPEDGLGPERAFFNMAGTAVQLAKAHHQLARSGAGGPAPAAAGSGSAPGDTAACLGEAERIYQVVRELREKRYRGRPHPHLAACLHGLAIVGYYKAVLLDAAGELASAAVRGTAALDQRARIAGSLGGPGPAGVLRDGDVQKSVDLLTKIMAASVLSRYTALAEGSAALERVLREMTAEWLSGPGRQAPGPGRRETPVLAFEHEVRAEVPAGLASGDDGYLEAVVQGALEQLGSLSDAVSGMEVIQVRRSGQPQTPASDALDVRLASPAPVSGQQAAALRWAITAAARVPDPAWLPQPSSPPAPPAAAPAPPAAAAAGCEQPDGSVPAGGFFEAAQSAPRPRYLSASYPDTIRPRRRFALEAAIGQTRGLGRADTGIQADIPPAGKRLLLSVYAPGLTIYGDHEQEIHVPAEGDSAPVRFDLEGRATGVQGIRLRAWDGGTCVGQLWAEVTVNDEVPRGGPDRLQEARLEAGALRGDVTLEVTHHTYGGENRYGMTFRDPEMRYPEETLLLRGDPAADAESLIRRLGAFAENSREDARHELADEGAALWNSLIPPAVQQHFWQCFDDIANITILSENDAFPWELLYPGPQDVGFLATRFPVTRKVEPWRRPRELCRQPARFVLPGDAPGMAARETERLRQILGAREANVATLGELRDLLASGGFGVLHFACHGGFDRDDRGPCVRLDRGFYPRELERAGLYRPAPLVFLNACRSAGPRRRCIGADGFAEKFVRAGAGAFIGSMWEVRDVTASEFAVSLYRLMTDDREPRSLGQAVTELRNRISEGADGDGGDPTWLAYAVYGHPEARFT
jgi:hypothetical protein